MEQIDTLLSGYKIIQDKERFMYGIDAVLLSAFSKSEIRKNDKVVDLGTGTGIIPLLLESSTPASHFSAIEVQTDSAEMARRSVELNNLQSKIEIINGDICSISSLLPKHSVEVVVSNPPYMISEHGKQNPNDAKSIARHEVLCKLSDIISAADYLLKPHGKFFMIHRPFRLPEIFTEMHVHGLEPKRMQLVYPFEDKEPNIVLIEARKNAQPRLAIEKPLIVRENSGEYTAAINEIYSQFKCEKDSL